MEFCERLAEVLKEKEITQRELAEKINRSEAVLSRYVNGARQPRMEALVDIAHALNVSVEYLTGVDEESIAFREVKNILCRSVCSMSVKQRLELMKILAK